MSKNDFMYKTRHVPNNELEQRSCYHARPTSNPACDTFNHMGWLGLARYQQFHSDLSAWGWDETFPNIFLSIGSSSSNWEDECYPLHPSSNPICDMFFSSWAKCWLVFFVTQLLVVLSSISNLILAYGFESGMNCIPRKKVEVVSHITIKGGW